MIGTILLAVFGGILIGTAGVVLFAMWYSNDKPSSASQAGRVEVELKLKAARKALGQIANRESIGEVRKIAHKAIERTA